MPNLALPELGLAQAMAELAELQERSRQMGPAEPMTAHDHEILRDLELEEARYFAQYQPRLNDTPSATDVVFESDVQQENRQ